MNNYFCSYGCVEIMLKLVWCGYRHHRGITLRSDHYSYYDVTLRRNHYSHRDVTIRYNHYSHHDAVLHHNITRYPSHYLHKLTTLIIIVFVFCAPSIFFCIVHYCYFYLGFRTSKESTRLLKYIS